MKDRGKKYLFAAPFRENDMAVWMETQKILFWTFLSKACLYKKTGQAETVKRKGVCENEVGGISKDTVGYGGDGVWT